MGFFGKRYGNVGFTAAIYDSGTTGAMLFYISGTANGGHQAKGSITGTFRNKWSHLVWTRQSGMIKTYYNGTFVASSADSSNLTNTYVSSIAVSETYYTGETVTGHIANMRIVKGTAVYTGNFTPPTAPVTAIPNTVLLLNFNNASITDSSRSSNLETVGSAWINTTVKKFGTGSMQFATDTDAVRHFHSPSLDLGTGALTVEFWNYITAKNGLFITIGPWPWYLGIGYDTYGGFGLGMSFGYSTYYALTDPGILNTWQHWAIVRDAAQYVKVYVDGKLIFRSSAPNTLRVYDGSSSGLYIGNSYDLRYRHRGYIDEVRLTKGVARYSGDTVGTVYFTPPTSSFPDN